jgi:predicted dehydrogenase
MATEAFEQQYLGSHKQPLKLALRSYTNQYLVENHGALSLDPKTQEDSQLWLLEGYPDLKVRFRNAKSSNCLSCSPTNAITVSNNGEDSTEIWTVDVLDINAVYGKTGSAISFQITLKNTHGKYLSSQEGRIRVSEKLDETCTWALEKRKITIAVVGTGNRGQAYSRYASEFPELCELVAIAEPRDYTRTMMAEKYKLPTDRVFKDWKELASLERIADAVVITTQDRMHKDPAVAFANKGYHILLEKPMSVSEEECIEITKAVEKNNVILAVGHVLRYTPYSRKIKELLNSGAIGDVVSMQHLEPVGFWHFAHSFVRGNWRRLDQSSFTLLAKSCHDIDWMMWMMPTKCIKVSSFGSLRYFTKENKPKDASSRCMDCTVERDCPYSAKKIYLDSVKSGNTKWPVAVIAEVPTEETVTEALLKGPYGRCVFECDNDVVDNQVVSMSFEGGLTASFSMIAFTEEICIRKTRIFGTKGEIVGDGYKINVFDFITQKSTVYEPEDPALQTTLSGHGNADYYLMRTFVDAVACNDPSKVLSSAQETLHSHLVVFAAEKARLESTVKDISW